jgi:predicted dehydrogenase
MLSFLRAKLQEVRTYSNYKKMLKAEELDAIFIATPTGLHVPIAVDCVTAGIPVFIEKPLATSAAEAKRLLEVLEERPVVNMVGYMGRYIDTFHKAKRIVDSGVLGKLQVFRSSMYIGQLFKKGEGWRYDKSLSGGGVVMTQNTHLIDKLLWIFGELDWVSGQTKSIYSSGVEDAAHVYFAFKNGLTGYMDSSWSARHYRTVTIGIHVQGERGTLDVDDDQVRLYLDEETDAFSEGWSVWRKPDLYNSVTFDIGAPQYTRQTEEFLGAVRGVGKIGSDVKSAFLTQCAVEAIYSSAAKGGTPVTVDEVMSNV